MVWMRDNKSNREEYNISKRKRFGMEFWIFNRRDNNLKEHKKVKK